MANGKEFFLKRWMRSLVEWLDGQPDFITFLRHHIAHNDNQRVT